MEQPSNNSVEIPVLKPKFPKKSIPVKPAGISEWKARPRNFPQTRNSASSPGCLTSREATMLQGSFDNCAAQASSRLCNTKGACYGSLRKDLNNYQKLLISGFDACPSILQLWVMVLGACRLHPQAILKC